MTTARSFRLTDAEVELLDKLAHDLSLSQTDVVRWGMAALRGLLRDGLDGSTTREFFEDGRRVIVLEGERGHSLTLAERRNGTFFAGGWSEPAEFEPDSSGEESVD